MSEEMVMIADEQVVVFQLGGESYGVGISLVDEIRTMTTVRTVPQAPEYVAGVINFRGRVTPVVDMRKRFGMPANEADRDTRIIVVDAGSVSVGLIVDGVSEVMRVPADIVEPPSRLVATAATRFLRGVAKVSEERLVLLLDLEALIMDATVFAQDPT